MDKQRSFFAIPATEILDRLIQSYKEEIVSLRTQLAQVTKDRSELEEEIETLRQAINQIGEN